MKEKLNQPIFINITLSTIFKLFFGIFLVYVVYVLRDLVLILLTSLVIASAIEPATKWLIKKKIPRVIGVLSMYIAGIALFAGIFLAFAPTLVKETKNVVDTIPQYVISISESEDISNFPALSRFVEEFKGVENSELISLIGGTAANTTAGLVSVASSIFGGIFSLILIIVLSFYFAVEENGISNFIRIIAPAAKEKYAIDLWKRSQKKIGLWMQGQLLLVVIIGVLTYLGLSIIGVENALFLSIVAAIFELIPVVGPILASIPAIGFALIQGGLTLAAIVLGIYVIIQQFESQLIHPLVVKKIVGIPALVAILALIIGAKIAGFLGVLIAVPVAGAIMEYINDVEKKKLAEIKELEG